MPPPVQLQTSRFWLHGVPACDERRVGRVIAQRPRFPVVIKLKRRPLFSVGCGQIRPRFHEQPPLVEQIRPRIGRFGFVLDPVGKRRFDHFARKAGGFPRPHNS